MLVSAETVRVGIGQAAVGAEIVQYAVVEAGGDPPAGGRTGSLSPSGSSRLRVVTAPERAPVAGRSRLASARRAGAIVYLAVFVPVVLALAVVTVLLLAGLITDPADFAHQLPVILIGLVMTTAGGVHIHRRLRRLLHG